MFTQSSVQKLESALVLYSRVVFGCHVVFDDTAVDGIVEVELQLSMSARRLH